jgi:hypothetical protein
VVGWVKGTLSTVELSSKFKATPLVDGFLEAIRDSQLRGHITRLSSGYSCEERHERLRDSPLTQSDVIRKLRHKAVDCNPVPSHNSQHDAVRDFGDIHANLERLKQCSLTPLIRAALLISASGDVVGYIAIHECRSWFNR